MVDLLLHAVDVGIRWADWVSSAEPVEIRRAGAILPDKGLINCDVIQADPGVPAHEVGHEIIVIGVGDGSEVSTECSTCSDGIVEGSGV